MHSKFKSGVIAFTILACSQALPAMAEGHNEVVDGGARFDFDINKYKGRKFPKKQHVPTSVQSGSVPGVSSFLDPSKLTPPPPAMVVPLRQPVQAITVAPRVQAEFMSEFGAPEPQSEQLAQPQRISQLNNPAPRLLAPQPIPQPAHTLAHNTALTGRIRLPAQKTQIAVSRPLPTIRNYPTGQGFAAGPIGGAGASVKTETSVNGKILQGH